MLSTLRKAISSSSPLAFYFADLLLRKSHSDSIEVAWAAALSSHTNSLGHVCINLNEFAGKPVDSVFSSHQTQDLESAGTRFPEMKPWRKALQESPVVGNPGDFTPLVLDAEDRLYLYRYWDYEKRVAAFIQNRMEQEIQAIDDSLAEATLDELFPPDPSATEPNQQRLAASVSARSHFCILSGSPGTGKTTTLVKILSLLWRLADQELRIAVAAPTGKAVARLQEVLKSCSFPVSVSTIHRLLGAKRNSPYFRHNRENPLPFDIIVVDETSMVSLSLMAKLIDAIEEKTRLILSGDRDQLASVEAGAIFADLCSPVQAPDTKQVSRPNPVVQLTKNYRFDENSGIATVSQLINQGEGEEVLALLQEKRFSDIEWKSLTSPGQIRGWIEREILPAFSTLAQSGQVEEALALFEQFRVVCALRVGPFGITNINSVIEDQLCPSRQIRRENNGYPGKPILITRNAPELNLFNGDTGLFWMDKADNKKSRLKAFFTQPDGSLLKVPISRLPEYETAYALTVHKSQGSEYETMSLILPDTLSPVLTKELIYTGITRAKKKVTIWGNESVFIQAVKQKTHRTSGLKESLYSRYE